jgi:hypothetical protein
VKYLTALPRKTGHGLEDAVLQMLQTVVACSRGAMPEMPLVCLSYVVELLWHIVLRIAIATGK